MSRESLELLRGTLDLLILKVVSLQPMHGYDISKWVHRKTGEAIKIEDSALYQSLRRLEKRGWLGSEWRRSATGREAKYYDLTPAGAEHLQVQTDGWRQYVRAMDVVLRSAEI